MKSIHELIAELCPNGVEYKKLSELGEVFSGLKGKSREDFEDGDALYVTYKTVFSNLSLPATGHEKVRIFESEMQTLLKRGDVLITGSSETAKELGMSCVVTEQPKHCLYLNSFCFVYRPKDVSLVDPTFMKYAFRSKLVRDQIIKCGAGVTRINLSKKRFLEIKLPIPPLEVQQEIVRILDEFTQLQAALEAELEARRQQYEYYRDQLLTFPEIDGGGYSIMPLRELAAIGTGSMNTNEAIVDGKYPFFVRSQKPLATNTALFDETAIITAGDGVGVGKVFHFVEGKYGLHQRAYRIVPSSNVVIPKYMFHYIRYAFRKYIENTAVHASVTSLRKPMFEKFPVRACQVFCVSGLVF